jgi:hypothetical protein
MQTQEETPAIVPLATGNVWRYHTVFFDHAADTSAVLDSFLVEVTDEIPVDHDNQRYVAYACATTDLETGEPIGPVEIRYGDGLGVWILGEISGGDTTCCCPYLQVRYPVQDGESWYRACGTRDGTLQCFRWDCLATDHEIATVWGALQTYHYQHNRVCPPDDQGDPSFSEYYAPGIGLVYSVIAETATTETARVLVSYGL